MTRLIVVSTLTLGLLGCAPKVGSEKWCAQTAEKPKGEWSANTAADYTKYCVLKLKPEED